MNTKRLLVNACIVLVLGLIGWYCYDSGKAYSVILENLPYKTADGVEHPSLEAAQAYIDTQTDPTYLLDGDRIVGTAVGKIHSVKIEILDENDKPTETVVIAFKITDLGPKRELNVAKFYAKAKKAQEKK